MLFCRAAAPVAFPPTEQEGPLALHPHRRLLFPVSLVLAILTVVLGEVF